MLWTCLFASLLQSAESAPKTRCCAQTGFKYLCLTDCHKSREEVWSEMCTSDNCQKDCASCKPASIFDEENICNDKKDCQNLIDALKGKLMYDSLVDNLLSHYKFNVDWNALKATAGKPKDMFAVLSVDLVNFKKINDGCGGHETGDQALKLFGENIEKKLNETEKELKVEHGELCKAYRKGGDEFAIICNPVGQTNCAYATTLVKSLGNLVMSCKKADPKTPKTGNDGACKILEPSDASSIDKTKQQDSFLRIGGVCGKLDSISFEEADKKEVTIADKLKEDCNGDVTWACLNKGEKNEIKNFELVAKT